MKYIKFKDGGDILIAATGMIYKFEKLENKAIPIYTDSPDNKPVWLNKFYKG